LIVGDVSLYLAARPPTSQASLSSSVAFATMIFPS